MSFSGRIDETNRPKVGIVQRIAMITATADAIGDENMSLAFFRVLIISQPSHVLVV
jgi:hypothetical protein